MHKRVRDVLSELMADDMDEKGEPISQNELSRRTGVTQPTIHRILSGESLDPDSATLSPLAAYFEVTPSQLRGDEPIIKSIKIRRVVAAMERMSEYQKDAMVKMGDTLIEPMRPASNGEERLPPQNGQ